MHRDDELEIIVIDKPGSIVSENVYKLSAGRLIMHLQPVHATGRYTKNSLIEILQTDFGFKKVFSKSVTVSKIVAFAKTVSHSSRKSTGQVDFWMYDHRTFLEEGQTTLRGVCKWHR
jgi:hypothetical protein